MKIGNHALPDWSKEKIWSAYLALWKDRDEQEHRAARAERRVKELEDCNENR
jgi:hypothetical protein